MGAAIKALRPSVALVTSERNLGHALTPMKRRLERVVAAYEDVATANSSAVRDAAVARLPRRTPHFRVIWPGIRPAPPSREAIAEHGGDGRAPARGEGPCDGAAHLATGDRGAPGRALSIVGAGPERARLEHEIDRLGLELVGRPARICRPRAASPRRADLPLDLAGGGLLAGAARGDGRRPSRGLDRGRRRAEIVGEGLRLAPVGDDDGLARHLLQWLDHPDQLAAASAAARGSGVALLGRALPRRLRRALRRAGILMRAEHAALEPVVAERAARVEPRRRAARSRVGADRAARAPRPSARNSLPQWGRGANGASAASTSASTRSTAGCSGFQVKWMPTVSRPYCGLSQRRSAAIVRISQTCSTGRIAPASARTASSAADGVLARDEVLGLQLLAAARA